MSTMLFLDITVVSQAMSVVGCLLHAHGVHIHSCGFLFGQANYIPQCHPQMKRSCSWYKRSSPHRKRRDSFQILMPANRSWYDLCGSNYNHSTWPRHNQPLWIAFQKLQLVNDRCRWIWKESPNRSWYDLWGSNYNHSTWPRPQGRPLLVSRGWMCVSGASAWLVCIVHACIRSNSNIPYTSHTHTHTHGQVIVIVVCSKAPFHH